MWKECNARIFHGSSTQDEIIISKIKGAIQEIVTSLPTQTVKAPPTFFEERILSMFDLL